MEVIRGLRIGDGSVIPQKIYLEGDRDSISYATLPNGIVLTSVSDIIDYNYTGKAGKVLLVFNKNSLIGTDTADYIGVGKSNTIGAVYFTNNLNMTGAILPNAVQASLGNSKMNGVVSAPKATIFDSQGCSLTAQSLGNFMLDAIANNRTRAGQLLATGGSNAGATAINSYLVTQGTTLASVLTQLSTWTITLNA